ncbi:MAG: UDP-N-acetylmuramoyl-L-alanine--D-glutamate ligase [Oscillospiraceae bacterium]|nr:UDP-N-acetylmuramoyl-L-alanine--D-glutamate ligase [Oscillospiraceae bacterium]
MNIEVLKSFFEGKRVVILGFGREGKVWLELLQRLGCCAKLAVADMNPLELEDPEIEPISGANYLAECERFDIILQSPGVIIKNRLSEQAKAKILTQTELLLRLRPCRIIGVTGTKGKSTTASLVHHFLEACGIPSMLIGNIGVPPLMRLEEMDEEMTAVVELSCHQLEFVRHSPEIALLLNIFPEHLDHYINFDAYANAKRNIARFQEDPDVTVANADLFPVETAGTLYSSAFGKPADVWTDGSSIFLFGEEIPSGKIHTALRGRHNLYNIAMALAAAKSAGADIGKCLESLPDFKGLEHRLEHVATINGVEFINDSICTVPEAAIAAVNAFDCTDCIILGGMDRGISYDVLGDFLNKGVVENVILLPDSGARIGKLISCPDVNVIHADNLEQAVSEAAKCAKKRVLLSPASASYGFYRNFEERGRHFKQLVLQLTMDN